MRELKQTAAEEKAALERDKRELEVTPDILTLTLTLTLNGRHS